jgi:hypothetical protein
MTTLARWQATITDDAGNVVNGASVTCRLEADDTLASLFTDRAGASSTSNPVFSDSEGYAYFHVTGGVYKVTASKGSFTRTWRYVAIGTAAEHDDGGFASVTPPQGRITLTTGVDILSSTVSGATTVYYTPSIGNSVPIYDGTRFINTTFGELSQATTDTTKSPAAVAANKNYDLFVWNDSGTIRCTRGPLWSSDTARGTGAGTTELQRVLGIWTNKVAITNGPAANKGTYVGTIRSNGSSQIDFIFGASAAGGTAGSFGVWNAYNRIPMSSVVANSTASWTYNSSTTRAVAASNTMRHSFVIGLPGESVEANWSVVAQSVAPALGGIGLDSTTTPSGVPGYFFGSFGQLMASYRNSALLGFHFLQALEAVNTGSAQVDTFFGSGSGVFFANGLSLDFSC